MSKKKLDTHSSLFRFNLENPQDVHVRRMGLEHSGPAIILLSGFNKNFHSDGAWYSLLQPLLAKSHRVHVIERFGNGFSSQTDQPSYASFVSALDKTLAALNEKEIVLVRFASANILAHLRQKLPQHTSQSTFRGMVWIGHELVRPNSNQSY